MIPAKRQQLILNLLAEREVLSILELSRLFGVSHMTVRRDIQTLTREGRVLPISGGVRLVDKKETKPGLQAESLPGQRAKTAMARAAADLVQPGMSIYLDVGRSSLALAGLISGIRSLVVVTNDLSVAEHLLQYSDCRLYHTGGQVSRENRSCFGEATAQFLRGLNLDISFLSAPAWNSRWITAATEGQAAVKEAAAASAARRILICGSGQYGQAGVFNAVALETLEMVITDEGLPESARRAVFERGVSLLVAPVEGERRRSPAN